jgi:cysteine desulfurase
MPVRAYFDCSATTPLDPRVAAAMRPYLAGVYGNPSSLHEDGRLAKAALDEARRQTAALIGAEPAEIVFTGSGSEAVNLAMKGVFEAGPGGPCHMLISAIEHQASIATADYLRRRGAEVERLSVDGDGLVDPDDVARRIRPDTRLVSVMAANNIVGTLQPIAEIARIAHERGVLFHTDAVQAAGKIPLDVNAAPIDLLSLSGHKIYGPKGVGALYVRAGTPLEPLIHGGGQERGARSGTENVPGIVALGKAASIAAAQRADEAARLTRWRQRLIDALRERVPNAQLLGHPMRRLPGHLCLAFAGQEGEAIHMLLALDEEGFAVSSGSACSSSHAGEPSYVLLAMGLDQVRARGSLRISLGRFNTEEEVERFIDVLPRVAAKLRPLTMHSEKSVPSERSFS